MQFTPQQMSGYKGYSPGVLVGNWSEDLQVLEDKMKLYEMTKASVSTNANSNFAVKAVMTEAAQLGPAALSRGNIAVVPFNTPLMIRSLETDGALALDISPKFAPRLNHVNVSFAPSSGNSNGQARNVWTIQRVPDPNADFYASVQEDHILHYGQKVKIVNEQVGSSGFYSLTATLQDTARSSGRLELAACLAGGNGTIFIVEPAGGAARGSKDGQPVCLSDDIVIVHSNTNAPLACEQHHRTPNSFGGEFEASCGVIKTQMTRAQSMVCTQRGNYFSIVMRPAGTPWTPKPPKSVPVALQRVKAKILERGGRTGFRGLVRFLGLMDENKDASLSRAEFRNAMEAFGVPMSSAELDAVFNTFDRNGDGKVTVSEFVRTMRSDMNARRLGLVQEAFDRLNKDGRGDIELHDLIDVYATNASKHPDALNGAATHETLLKEFVAAWGGSDGRITRSQFIEYYSDVSAGIDGDDYFELMLRNAWHISGGEGWCENTTARRILVVFQDDSQKVIELKDDLGLQGKNTQGILKKLADQGVTNVKRFELCA